MLKKVLLISAPLDKEHQPINPGYSVLAPSLALATLKTKINANLPKVKVKIIDGSFTSLDKIEQTIIKNNFDLVGFSNIFTNTENSLKLAKLAKKQNNKTIIVFGNTNASAIADRLAKLKFIDYIVKNDGELAIIEIINEKANTKVIEQMTNINDTLKINFDDFKKQLKPFNYKNKDYNIDTIVPFPMSSTRGCIKAMKCKRCYFCCIQYNNLRILKPKNFWIMAKNLHQKYNIGYIFETGDDFLIGNYPEELLKAKPKKGLENLKFRVYADFDSITDKKLKILKKLNVKIVFLGLENIDKTILKNNNKLYSSITNWNSFEEFFKKYDLFEKNNIEFCLAMLFGLKGETKKSLEKNKLFIIEMLKKYKMLKKLFVGIVVPLAGSKLFEDLLANKKLVKEYYKIKKESLLDTPNIDYNLLSRLMIKYNCKVSYEEIQKTINELKIIGNNYLNKQDVADHFSGGFDFKKYNKIIK